MVAEKNCVGEGVVGTGQQIVCGKAVAWDEVVLLTRQFDISNYE
jgi:hypothetical protein